MSAFILRQNPNPNAENGWDKKMTNPIDWTVGTHRHICLGDRAFFFRSGADGGIFAVGTVVTPPPDCDMVSPAVFRKHNLRVGKTVAHVNVQVDIPSDSCDSGQPCSVSHPVLIPVDQLKADKRFGEFFGRITRPGHAGGKSGLKIDPAIVDPLLEECRKASRNLRG